MQNRRVGLLAVPQFGQIRGGTTSPSGILCPHFMQNRRSGRFAVPQLAQIRTSSGVGSGAPVAAGSAFGTASSSEMIASRS
jgi:hypothetical protein